MDWSKAKSILIAIFLALNAYLAVTIYNSVKENSVSAENIANTVKVLNERGYTLECEIPATVKACSLSYENGTMDVSFLKKKLLGSESTPISDDRYVSGGKTLAFLPGNGFRYSNEAPSGSVDINDIPKVTSYALNFLKSLKLPVSEFYLDEAEMEEDAIKLVFIGKYRQYFVFYNRAELLISKKGIVSLDCRFIEVKRLSHTTVKFTPAYQVLLRNFPRGKGGTIVSIDLGFWCPYLQQTKTESSSPPLWRVKMKDGTVRYFTASDGSEFFPAE